MYFVAIIDIFTKYTFKKKAEHFFKRPFQGKGISCVNPDEYAGRFRDFVEAGISGATAGMGRKEV